MEANRQQHSDNGFSFGPGDALCKIGHQALQIDSLVARNSFLEKELAGARAELEKLKKSSGAKPAK